MFHIETFLSIPTVSIIDILFSLAVHGDAMKLRIRTIRKGEGLTLEQLAEKAGISRSHLNQIELGKKSINSLRMQQIADALDVDVGDLFEPAAARAIPVLGHVGGGARVSIEGQGAVALYDVPCPPQLRPEGMAAVETVGDSMLPAIAPGSVLFYHRDHAEGVASEDLGRVCIAATDDGNVWVKQVMTGTRPGLYHLISVNPLADNLLDRRIRWAAPVLLVLPPELVTRA